jgi:hypothetical protein
MVDVPLPAAKVDVSMDHQARKCRRGMLMLLLL